MTGSQTLGQGDLFSKTLRTVAVLVGACVLFVGTLSALSVLIASRAMATSPTSSEARELAPASTAVPPKKPLSI